MSPDQFGCHGGGGGSTFDDIVHISVLVPNGLYITVKANRDSTLYEIKEDVFDEAQRLPLFGMLHDKETYVFKCTNSSTYACEELLDETKRVTDVRPFLWLLNLVARKNDKSELHRVSEIGALIGKRLHEFDALISPEINDMRSRMRNFAEEIERERESASRADKLRYIYPPRLVHAITIAQLNNFALQSFIATKLVNNKFTFEIRFQNNKRMIPLTIDHDKTPEDAIELALNALNPNNARPAAEYCLKVCGRDEYLFNSEPLLKYEAVYTAIANNKYPSFIAVLQETLKVEQEPEYVTRNEIRRPYSQSISSQHPKKKLHVLAEDIQKKFAIKINNTAQVNCCDETKVAIEMGLFHGEESLCDAKTTADQCVMNLEATWDECVQFDIDVADMPRAARLCLVLFERKGNKKTPRTWVNLTVFDYRGLLRTGGMCLAMWRYSNEIELENILNPLGTVMPNTYADDPTSLTITFERYMENDTSIVYERENRYSDELLVPVLEDLLVPPSTPTKRTTSKAYFEQFKQICERDALTKMDEQDKELVWILRDSHHVLPSSLPHVLNAVKWNDRTKVREMMMLLSKWPPVSAEIAITLLDYAYPDAQVRAYAVRCLECLTDETLSLYLLQLVQALKFESYLMNDLTKFLLRRALRNRQIGHQLFWLLRSEIHEMHDGSISVTCIIFALILEAYCYGAKEHMSDLKNQTNSMNKLADTSDYLKREIAEKKASRDKQKHMLADAISEKDFSQICSNISNPLDSRVKLCRIKTDKCAVMDSKMKPLILCFSNEDIGAEDTTIMFKQGDDLRQDMLTIQMLQLMDRWWKEAGYDFRMTPYRCMSTNFKQGLIEIVLNAKTIASIQKEKGLTSVFSKGTMLAWLKDKNPDKESLAKAIDEFSMSCAGYCVATYVLGIGDRHPGNIMLRTDGKLLHIDFGHILGNFKTKFGIKREGAFLLSTDFVHIITNGNKNPQKFEEFKHHCEQAFLILRRRSSFIISLFAMMLSAGMPELSSIKDLNYLREALFVDRDTSETEARKNFQAVLKYAKDNSSKTTANWFAHALAH